MATVGPERLGTFDDRASGARAGCVPLPCDPALAMPPLDLCGTDDPDELGERPVAGALRGAKAVCPLAAPALVGVGCVGVVVRVGWLPATDRGSMPRTGLSPVEGCEGAFAVRA